jgi:hypothetical protein
MRKIYQEEWFGIQFSSFAELDSKNIAGSDFYARFYAEFFRKFKSYDDLSEDWRSGKQEVADHLAKIIHGYSRVLSIGCGNGYIENLLVGKHNFRGTITALEPNIASCQWLNTNHIQLVHGYFPEAILDAATYNFAYAASIDYVFSDIDYVKFLKSLKQSGIDDLLLTIVFTPDTSFKGTARFWL